jgi:hypothetical protein
MRKVPLPLVVSLSNPLGEIYIPLSLWDRVRLKIPLEAGLDKGTFSNEYECKILKNKGQKRQ